MIDPLENDLFDLPDYEHTEDEAFPPLPPPHSPDAENGDTDLANGDDWTQNVGQTQKEEALKPARKAVKRPQPKLDAQRLTSQRGLPALRHLFDGTKFKGKGHEAEDLKILLRQMENWAHRLFPKLQFEDFLSRLESLGNKKEVQTCLKRIRMDMPILHDDFTSEEVVVQMEEDILDLSSEDITAPRVSSPPSASQTSVVDLNEETRQRIERNRLLALERRKAKMQTQTDSQVSLSDAASLPIPSQAAPADEIPEDFDADLLETVDKVVETTSPLIKEECTAGPAETALVTEPQRDPASDALTQVKDADD
ncbi:TIMELESS-interacting protein [Spea bombifrons]|uniref:TIMELESS-interacting protein n=1 Tax=Spea bombifrons TaxID=233779 RepID=UPI00234A5F1A|nr:TIMELESS-interacting protein [Spea bombifrons]